MNLYPLEKGIGHTCFSGSRIFYQTQLVEIYLYERSLTSIIEIPAGIYLLKVNYRKTRTRCEICSKLTIKLPERRHWRQLASFWYLYLLTLKIFHTLLSVSIVNFEHVISGWGKKVSKVPHIISHFKNDTMSTKNHLTNYVLAIKRRTWFVAFLCVLSFIY